MNITRLNKKICSKKQTCGHMIFRGENGIWVPCNEPGHPYMTNYAVDVEDKFIQWVCPFHAKEAKIENCKLTHEEFLVAEMMLL